MSARPPLADTLRAEIDAFTALGKVLEAEHAALIDADADGLLSLSQDKARAVERLAELAQARGLALRGLSLDPRTEGFRAGLAAQSDDLLELWDTLISVAATARERNLDNGSLLSTRMTHNRAALDTLNAVARRHTVYGPDGQSILQSANRALGQA